MARTLSVLVALILLAPLAHAQDVLRVTDAAGTTRLLIDDDEFAVPPYLTVRRPSSTSTPLMTLEETHLRINAVGGPTYLGQIALRIRAGSPLQDVLRIDANGGLVAMGKIGDGLIPTSGAGERLMWHPYKAAFRAGSVDATQWDEANVGFFSWAGGWNTRAAGLGSVALGRDTEASGYYTTALGAYASTNSQEGALVLGDASTVSSGGALVSASAPNQLTGRFAGGYRFFTTSTLDAGVTIQSGASTSNWGQSNAVISTSTGAMLTTSGIWQNASDVNRKHAFEAVSGEDVLARLRGLPITTWSYRTDADDVRHMGPTAQDFRRTFGLGQDSLSIGTVDADGVALAAAQALDARTRQQAEEIAALRAELAALRAERSAPVHAALPALGVLALLGLAGAGIRRRSRGPGMEGPGPDRRVLP